MSTREVTFTEEDVEEWSVENDDYNPLYTDPEAASDGPFGRCIVPGMMILDNVSGMLLTLGDDDESVILSGVTAARFRDPVFVGETVTISIEVVEENRRFTSVDFEARVEARDSLVANGAVNVTIE